MTTVFLLMRVRRPRPPIRALLRQPGTVAGLAVTFGLILVAGWMHFLFFGRLIDGTVTPIAVGGTVALAWTCLALVRRWEAEPSWVDRMGRLLGRQQSWSASSPSRRSGSEEIVRVRTLTSEGTAAAEYDV